MPDANGVRKPSAWCPGWSTGWYLVGVTDVGIVPVGADVADGTHDEGVSAVAHLLPVETSASLPSPD